MPAIHETIYPRFKSHVTKKELLEIYTPTIDEIALAKEFSKGEPFFPFILMLKTFQRLGYFIQLSKIPKQIIIHLSEFLMISFREESLEKYYKSRAKDRHVEIIRKYLNIKKYSSNSEEVIIKIIKEQSKIKDESVDLINIAIEELIRNSYELPAYSTIERVVNNVYVSVQRLFFIDVSSKLNESIKTKIDSLFEINTEEEHSQWSLLKKEAGSPTVTHIKELMTDYSMLNSFHQAVEIISCIPYMKVKNLAKEANAYNISKMKEIEPYKRYTLVICLIKIQTEKILDNIAEMLIKRIMKIHRKGKIALEEYIKKNHNVTDNLIMTLRDILIAFKEDVTEKDKLNAISLIIDKKEDDIIENCEKHISHSDNNYFSFLWQYYKSHRSVLIQILKSITIKSTNQNVDFENDIKFLIDNVHKKSELIQAVSNNKKLVSLSWVSITWYKFITGTTKKTFPDRINRKKFEICLFTQLVDDLKSGNIYIDGSNVYSDYRKQLISTEEYNDSLKEYGEQVNLPTDSRLFIEKIKTSLQKSIKDTDNSFPNNQYVKIVNGEPIIAKLKKKNTPVQLKQIEKFINQKIQPVSILDIITDSESWINWSRFFGLYSGHSSKLDNPLERYILNTFCYGCNLGPTQTVRSIEMLNRKSLSWINQTHITEEKIQKATNHIINAYNKFSLPKFWGSGERSSADGTMFNIYEQNLLSEYHIRYGGYGALGYYHVSDKYIALFSNFIPCGVWEGVYILDLLQNNESDIQPDIIHGDTQSQNSSIFALSFLLGIKLMPRIRNWKLYTLCKTSAEEKYKHIDELFTDNIDWKLIEMYLPDMFRVTLSVKAGRITPSTILKKLGTYNKKNKLYLAFRELGRVIRTGYLMEYIRDIELRQTIQASTNKSEGFNGFTKWIFFGNNGIITENSRDRQRKSIKYNHLVANCVIFYNVNMLTKIIQEFNDEGYVIEKDTLECLSPYITHHIDRYGKYKLDLERKINKPKYSLKLNSIDV